MQENYNYTVLGERIRNARKQKHLTQEKLAEKCDLSTAYIGHIERGTRSLSIETLIKLSSVLNVSTDYLLLGINNNPINLENIINSISSHKHSQYQKFISVVKILAENIDKL